MKCSCGKSVDVPTLSNLRKSAGQSAIPLSTIDRIRIMVRDGALPAGEICPVSGRPADETILIDVQCERAWVRGGESWDTGKVIAYVLLFGWIGALIASRKSQPYEELGRDTSLTVPLRISSEVRPKLQRMRRQRKLKSLLSQTPIYSQLLKEYPEAIVSALKNA
jgi:hypothetical protein